MEGRPDTDLYGRRPTSRSRGRTIERIMAMQHAAGMIPGTEDVLDERPGGSIAAAIAAFHADWVESKPVTTRRAYERSLAFFARDLAGTGPHPREPFSALAHARVERHLDWRLEHGLHDPGELQRSALHLARLCEWAAERGFADVGVERATMRAAAASRIEHAPPPFHAAGSADALRDTSTDASLLDPGAS